MEMYKQDLLQRLYNLDEDASLLYTSEIRFRLIIVGGGALIVRDVIARATSDIDVLCNADKKFVELMESYDINCRVHAYENCFPYNYEDRIKLVWSGKNVDYYTASLEDIVISKLDSTARPEDLDDARKVAEYIDWEKLEYLARHPDELKSSTLNDSTYQNFLANYEEYERRYRPCRD